MNKRPQVGLKTTYKLNDRLLRAPPVRYKPRLSSVISGGQQGAGILLLLFRGFKATVSGTWAGLVGKRKIMLKIVLLNNKKLSPITLLISMC